LIIIGAGPAGLTAALYAGRFKMDTLLIEKMSVGGQILLSPSIENYPGFPGGISTFDLVERFRSQVDELGVQIENSEIIEIDPKGEGFEVVASDKNYLARTVIIASGAFSKRLNIPGEERLTGKGVSYCGTCDGPLFKNKDIVVVGGGDRAVEDALFLADYGKSVTLIHRRNEFRASGILVDKLKSNPKIKLVLDSVITEITGEQKVESVRVRNVKDNSATQLSCQGVFIFVGIIPNTQFLKNLLEKDEFGFIITDLKQETSKAGIFAAGDCVRKSLYQVVSACSDGAIAADSAHKYILGS
jgi:thioredoxin reductase (NADPH)